ncbi:MAG: phosphoribosylformylglycinamidine synthase subunit PurS [Bacteroidota bacterium]|nr:phosphoribosylformylglycinamidine synthase subunit PurS [Bacteroidota bacterium]
MQFLVKIEIMPRKELLDPQGKAVTNGLHNIGFKSIEDVRVGKCISYITSSDSEANAHSEAEKASKDLLANLIMESYHISVTAL